MAEKLKARVYKRREESGLEIIGETRDVSHQYDSLCVGQEAHLSRYLQFKRETQDATRIVKTVWSDPTPCDGSCGCHEILELDEEISEKVREFMGKLALPKFSMTEGEAIKVFEQWFLGHPTPDREDQVINGMLMSPKNMWDEVRNGTPLGRSLRQNIITLNERLAGREGWEKLVGRMLVPSPETEKGSTEPCNTK
ncbi:hypothetical protein ACFL2D_02920 [Patescibacteria group bacterium]